MSDELIEFCDATLGMAKTAKRMFCEFSRGPSDGPPVLIWLANDDVAICQMRMPTDDYPAPQALHDALQEGFAEFGVPRLVSVIVEAYAKREVQEDDFRNIKRGQLQEAFKQNADPSVEEVITCLTFDLTGRKRSAVIFYKYDDSGMPVFDEPVYEESEMLGAITDVIDDFTKFVTT